MFTHIVFFKLKEANKENVNFVKERLLSLDGNIPKLRYIEVGEDVIRSERSFDVSLITRFDNKEDYEEYATCKYHVEEVINKIKPYLQESKAMDYFN